MSVYCAQLPLAMDPEEKEKQENFIDMDEGLNITPLDKKKLSEDSVIHEGITVQQSLSRKPSVSRDPPDSEPVLEKSELINVLPEDEKVNEIVLDELTKDHSPNDTFAWEDLMHPPPGKAESAYSPTLKFTYYSQKYPLLQGDSFPDLAKQVDLEHLLKENTFWLDLSCPSRQDVKIVSKLFNIHPLTVEDILSNRTREKCEIFENYIFICMRTCEENFGSDEEVNFYIIVFSDYAISIHNSSLTTIENVIRKLDHFTSFVQLTPDWMLYAILDDSIDNFMPVIKMMESEVDAIDDLVLVLSQSDQMDLLKRIRSCSKRLTQLLTLLRPKKDILRSVIKRCPERMMSQVLLYLRDIQDHILEMILDLENSLEVLNRSHSNYLALISIEMAHTSNQMGRTMNTFTIAASLLLPLQVITGMWGMNMPVPGQEGVVFNDLGWFFAVVGIMVLIVFGLIFIGRKYNWYNVTPVK